MQESQVAIEGISQQAVPDAVEMLNKLKATSTQLERLSSEISDNPSILLRGRAAAAPGPGE